jgi:subtilase family serine protease
MAPGLSQVNVYEGSSDVDILNEMATPKLGEPRPNQISCSYGISGNTALEPALIQLALQGQSFFYASGDSGAYQPNGLNTNTQQNFIYMTAVGGTELIMRGNGVSYDSETVWNNGPGDRSSGGVLTQVPIPDYQKKVNMSQNHGSTVYRNIPDVAMDADFFYLILTDVYTNGNPPLPGQPGGAQGTSGAAPLWAGFTALVNQQAAEQGKAPVGLLNPALYDIAQSPLYAAAFHDILIGSNENSGSPNLYTAAPGYDLCTGLGSPTGTALIDALAGLAGPVFVDFNYTGSKQDGNYETPFKTMAGGTNKVGTGGTVIIRSAGSSAETMTISKRLTITASDGAGTIGH